MSSSTQDKNLPATEQRLKKARKDGQVARSKDLSNLAVLGGGAAVLFVLIPLGLDRLRLSMQRQFRFDESSLQHPQEVTERLTTLFGEGFLIYLPLGLVGLAVSLFVAFASGSWAISTKPMTPDLQRLSPLAGLGRLFSKQQLVETVKLSAITVMLGFVAWKFLSGHLQPFTTLLLLPLEGALAQLGIWLGLGLGFLLMVLVVVAVVDFPVQKFLHKHRMRMSREEVRREHKESDGDPQMKGQRRRRQRELAQRNSVMAVPRADLVVMNPTHYAVAIQYDDASMSAPRVIAKGADLIAMKIRDVAKAHDIPVLQSPMLARALYAHAEIDEEIPSALYTAVAQVLAYVYQLKAAMAGRGAMPREMPTPEVPPELDPHFRPRAVAH